MATDVSGVKAQLQHDDVEPCRKVSPQVRVMISENKRFSQRLHDISKCKRPYYGSKRISYDHVMKSELVTGNYLRSSLVQMIILTVI